MIRLQLGAEDLLRVRFAAAPAPLLELALAIATLQRRDALFDGWRRDAAARLPHAARRLFELVPAAGTGPTFLDPVSEGLDDGLDAVLSASAPLVHRELRRVTADRPSTPWLRALDDRDTEAWRVLAGAVRAAHGTLLAPVQERIMQSFRTDVAWRTRRVAGAGLGSVLDTLHPALRRSGSTVRIATRRDLTIRLHGAGITLLPSAFWTGRPLITSHPDGSLLLVYPSLSPLPLTDGHRGPEPLAALLGRTRAAVLGLAATPRSTGQLATELGISAASASEHTRTLRGVGLLASHRAGKSVIHSVTPLGAGLLSESRLPDHLPGGPPRR